jgi:hypothetical protein
LYPFAGRAESTCIENKSEKQEMKPQEKRVIHIGDVLRKIYLFKLTGYSGENLVSGISSEEDGFFLKRKRQELADETLARDLQVS